jgi:hypothetical protein
LWNMETELKDKIRDYERLMLQKKALENEIDMLKEEIIPGLPADTVIETDNGQITVESRVKWIYSIETQLMDKGLKEAQMREKQDGTAEQEPGKPFLVYREGKVYERN